MAASQKQIAEELGVSVALVSRVLSGKAESIGIAPETIKRVLATAKGMGYVPSAAALALKGKATRTIGVVVYDFKDPFFGAIIEQLQRQAREHEYSLVLAGFLQRNPDERDLRSLYKHTIDGLIVIGSDLSTDWLQPFKQVPVARIGRGASDERSVRVAIDDEQAGGLLINHLLESGRKRLTCLCADLPYHHLRQKAFERVAKRSGVDLVCAQSPERDAFAAGMQLAGDLTDRFDALVCVNDQLAMGALHVLHRSGTSSPDPIAVTGFDDIVAAGLFIPPITTVRQPVVTMVQHAFAAVTGNCKPAEILLQGELIVRESSRLSST